MKILPILIILSLLCIKASTQTILTKDEILLLWPSHLNKTDSSQDAKNITVNPKANERINFLIDSLHSEGIDSIIIYSISYPGYISLDPCRDYIYPIYSYLLWTSPKGINIKTIKGKCETSLIKIDSSNIFDYYRTNKESITKEIVMPVIYSAQRIEADKITYLRELISHEPNYSVYIILGNTFKTISFSQNDIQNEESLFHDHNLSLKSIKLWKLIKNEIGDSHD